MHTAFREPGLIGNLPDTLLGIVTKLIENQKTLAQNPMSVCPKREPELFVELSPSAYMTDTPLSRLKPIPSPFTAGSGATPWRA